MLPSSASAFTSIEFWLYQPLLLTGKMYGALPAVLSVFHVGSTVSIVSSTDSDIPEAPSLFFADTVSVHFPSFALAGIVKSHFTVADFLSAEGVTVTVPSGTTLPLSFALIVTLLLTAASVRPSETPSETCALTVSVFPTIDLLTYFPVTFLTGDIFTSALTEVITGTLPVAFTTQP